MKLQSDRIIELATSTIELATALKGDIAKGIAASLNQTNVTQATVEPFLSVTIGNVTVNRRRLLDTSVPVSFTLLGNITTIAAPTTGGSGSTMPSFNATTAVTSVTASYRITYACCTIYLSNI